jgi:hypothetical protein
MIPVVPSLGVYEVGMAFPSSITFGVGRIYLEPLFYICDGRMPADLQVVCAGSEFSRISPYDFAAA